MQSPFSLKKFVLNETDPQPKSPIILPQQQGFILGRTPERKYVYIYANQELRIWHELTLNTWTYFHANQNWEF